MQESSTSLLQFRQDIETELRRHIREAIEVSLTEEIAAALGSERHERTDHRRGYRHGTNERTVTTTQGARAITVPRGRVVGDEGTTTEFGADCSRGMRTDPRGR